MTKGEALRILQASEDKKSNTLDLIFIMCAILL